MKAGDKQDSVWPSPKFHFSLEIATPKATYNFFNKT